MKRLFCHLMVLCILFLGLSSKALADATISGSQTRGHGADGKLRCTGVSIQNGGTVVKVKDSGAGFWLQSDKGRILRFNRAAAAVGTVLEAATWYAYPNLYQGRNEAGVSVVVRTGRGGGANNSARAVSNLSIGIGYPIQARNNPNNSNWSGTVTFTSLAGGDVHGEVAWPSLDSINQIDGTFGNGTLTFKESAYIKKGGAHLNCVYTMKYNNLSNNFEGTWYEEGKVDVYNGPCSLALKK